MVPEKKSRGRAQALRKPAVYCVPPPEGNVAYWRINGFRASISIWTVAEWEQLKERPADAQYYPSGVWCALRME